ncbi:alginate export family protein [Flavobacterium sedimenticola]|uniref:Alginate export family protein n=1 Tax=Flavobacterium sedimenticola TaxID=3043286 RepID=A0ABT6XNY5_9FLAO|nr:alginate export family protein [Flavobacterium sedimenticola]MDI9256790.1 alginate export family protein [Flavobacterium sedimenticola]
MQINKPTFFITALLFFTVISTSKAQNKISWLRYEDDFTSLKKDSIKKGLDKIKYMPLGQNNYISLGGEFRDKWQYYDNLNFGDVPPSYSKTDVFQYLRRIMLHANIEFGNHFRFFMQLNHTSRDGNSNPLTPEIDENQLSLHQAFAELKRTNWNFRLGQQELFYGNHRLITFREGPNTRQAFNGLLIKRKFNNGTLDFFAVSKVISKQYVFDDESMHDGLLGIYGTQFYRQRKLGLDYYVVNFQSRDRRYNYQTGYENRQTYGIRLFSNLKTVNVELEGAYQSGTFNDLTIEAYNVLADANLSVFSSKRGLIGFTAHVASGDKNNTDHKLNSYNLLYAKPAYGLVAQIGATNILSFSPYIKINPLSKLNVLAQVFFLSRNSSQDGTYAPGMIQNRPKPNALFATEKRTLGQLYLLETIYRQNKNYSLAFDASYFKAGSYPKATGKGENILYVSLKSTFKF